MKFPGVVLMKVKVKIKDCQLKVKVRLPFKTHVNQHELEFFSSRLFRGFLRPKTVKRNTVTYYGPIGISLFDRLQKQITRVDFFFVMEQIVDAIQKLQKNSFLLDRVVWDVKYSYINEATKELQLIYLPLEEMNYQYGDVRKYVEDIAHLAKPVGDQDKDFVARFSYFLRSMSDFDANKVEDYIKHEEPNVVNIIKKHRTSRSGFITDCRKDYYDHYNSEDEERTELLVEEGNATELLEEAENPTDLLADEETGLLEPDQDGATSLLIENNKHFPSLTRLETEEKIFINKPVFRIGKERSYVDYCVDNNEAISRSHADLITRGDRYFIMDLNSTNKTYVNDEQISAQYETEIFDGDRLRLGNEEFVFHE